MPDPLSPAELSALRAAVDVLQGKEASFAGRSRATAVLIRAVSQLLAMAEAAAQVREAASLMTCEWLATPEMTMEQIKPRMVALIEALDATPPRGVGARSGVMCQPLWVEYRERWLKKGYDIHAYHGFKAGPLPGCNAGYGDTQCNASIDEHCHCGSGDHLALDKAHTSQ